MGLQSALLSNAFRPIYLDSITVGDMFDQEALERALHGRMAAIQGITNLTGLLGELFGIDTSILQIYQSLTS